MSDLNLIPYEVRIEKEKRVKKIKTTILVILAVLIIGAVNSIPIYYIYNLTLENRALEGEIEELSYVSEELKALEAQKAIIGEQVNVMESLSKDEVKWTEVIKNISSITPEEITVENLNGNSKEISMKCSSKSRRAIAVFVANLESSEEFTAVKLYEIIPDKEENKFSFSLSFKLKSLEGVVK